MTQTLEEFIEEVKTKADSFAAGYREKAKIDGKTYPLEFDNDNSGLWREFFYSYMDGGDI